MTAQRNISEWAIEVAERMAKHQEISDRKEIIERELTAATNALNEATKGFDAAVADFKQTAPRNTDWHNQRHMKAAE